MTVARDGRCIGGKMRRDVGEDTIELGYGVDGKRLRPRVDLMDDESQCEGRHRTRHLDRPRTSTNRSMGCEGDSADR
jgi:hypothetical protein